MYSRTQFTLSAQKHCLRWELMTKWVGLVEECAAGYHCKCNSYPITTRKRNTAKLNKC